MIIFYSLKMRKAGSFLLIGGYGTFKAIVSLNTFLFLRYDRTTEVTRPCATLCKNLINSIQPTKDGGCIILGIDKDFNLYVIKLNSQGEEIWAYTYGKKCRYDSYQFQPTEGSGCLVAGLSEKGGKTYILLVDSKGNVLKEVYL